MSALRFQVALAARYLRGRPLRTTLTSLAVIFGVSIFFGLSQLVPALSAAYRQNLLMSAGQVDLTVSHASGGSFRPSALDAVLGTPGVATATGLLRRNALLPKGLGAPGAPVNTVSVVGLDSLSAFKVRSYGLASGRLLNEGDSDAAMLPSTLADKVGLKVGDVLALPSATGTSALRVVGIVSALPVAGVEDVYVPLATAQRMFDQAGQINTVEALFAPGSDRARVVAAVESRLGSGYRLGNLQAGGELETALKATTVIYGAFGFMALVMGAFIIYNTFRTVVAERRHDFGMLRAVGASRRTILSLTLIESATQGLVGSLIGLALGYALAAGLTAALATFAESILRMRVPWPIPTIGAILAALLLGVGITVAGALLPAIAATRVTPLDALRPATQMARARALRRGAMVGVVMLALAAVGLISSNAAAASLSSVLLLVGLVLLAPALVRPLATVFGRVLDLALAREGQIAQENVSRQPDRAAITASTTMVGLAIGIGLMGMITSLETSFSGYLERSFGARYLAMPASIVLGAGNVGAGPELARRLREIPGMGGITSLRQATTDVAGSPLQLIGIDAASFPALSGLVFDQGEAGAAYAAVGRERAVILNPVSVLQLKVKMGDTIRFTSPEGEVAYRVVGVGLDYLNAKLASGYVSQANLAADFHDTTDLLLMANPAPGADAAAVQRAAERVVADYPAFSLVDSTTFIDEQIRLFKGISVAMYALLFAVAAPGLIGMINTLAINVIERTRELGTLRAVGMTRGQVGRMILGESLLLAALGTALGILAGVWLGAVLVRAVGAIGYGGGGALAYEFPWAGALVAIAVGLLFGVLAALIPARQAARLPIVAALRYE